MKKFILECCVDSVESAIAAKRGGADRLEVCANLVIGGTTPTRALYEAIKRETNLPIHVLVRPRFGDFLYSDYEWDIMREEVKEFSALGADGIVSGGLNPDGSLNLEQMELLMEAASGKTFTLHRAFDVAKDPMKVCEQACMLGIHGVLTSGQRNTSLEGSDLLGTLVKEFGHKISVIAGGGVCDRVMEELYQKTGVCCYHISGKARMESSMEYRNDQVSMGVAGLDENEIWRTQEEAVKKAKEVLNRLWIVKA